MRASALLLAVLSTAGALAQNTNCPNATQVCSDAAFSGNNTGFGTQELPNNNTTDGCLTVEHQSSWYYFQPVTSGTVELTITTAIDYDFAIWTGGCGNLGSPVRCSYAGSFGNTGLGNGAADVTEDASGNRWVAPLNVVAGQIYIMLIDNFTSNSTPFTLDWTFSNGATLNCTPITLPTELVSFMSNYDANRNVNKVSWSTLSERDNDYFSLERSTDGSAWAVIDQQDGAGTTTSFHNYQFEDYSFEPGKVNYYRLTQTDFDGQRTTFDVIAVDNTTIERPIAKVLNTMGQEIPRDTKGLVILLYEDGSSQRIFRQ